MSTQKQVCNAARKIYLFSHGLKFGPVLRHWDGGHIYQKYISAKSWQGEREPRSP